jgi:iron(III) transport system ATP-binding protein
VARALVVEPEILLLDEPLSTLDANLREEMRFEIRRLHEAFGITTLYVTHDQAEAMVISDRIAVVQDGRIVQIGTADEVFEQPRTRFVAEFIGKTNVIDGVATAPDAISRDSLWLRVASASLVPGAAVAVSIRPHYIELVAPWGERADARTNTAEGVVERASFLGERIEYQIRVARSDIVLRVSAPLSRRLRPGDPVGLSIDPAACVLLSE